MEHRYRKMTRRTRILKCRVRVSPAEVNISSLTWPGVRFGTAFHVAARERHVRTALLLLENRGNMKVLGA